MAEENRPIEELFKHARTDREALGKVLERYRPFLLLMAKSRIDPRLAARTEASDVVQQTFADAVHAFDRFDGSTEPEFSAWIQRIHVRNLADVTRTHVKAEKQSIDRERAWRVGDSSATIHWADLAADSSTPSRRLIKAENALRLATMIETLPEMQREAVRLRHLEGCPIVEIAQRLDSSVTAVAGLIKRGVQTLRDRMSEDSWN